MKNLYNIIFLISILFTLSCEDFLKEHSQNLSYVDSPSDLDELLLGTCYLNQTKNIFSDAFDHNLNASNKEEFDFIPLHIMDDDTYEAPTLYEYWGNDLYQKWEVYGGYYRWATQPSTRIDSSSSPAPLEWEHLYKRIGVLNSILEEIPDVEYRGGDINQLNRITAETLFLRAWNYFMLINYYGAPYSKNEPEDPWGVPLKLDSPVHDIFFTRHTVGAVWRQIKKDLTDAINYFNKPDVDIATSKLRANKDACYTFLSRVCLYMEDYEGCIEAANQVENTYLIDFNGFVVGSNFALLESPETIFSQGPWIMHYLHGPEHYAYYENELIINPDTWEFEIIRVLKSINMKVSYGVSDELANLYDDNDLRLPVFFTKGIYKGGLVCRKYRQKMLMDELNPITNEQIAAPEAQKSVGSYGWIRTAEVILNKAEAEACIGNPEAVNTIQKLLTKRYKALPSVPSGGKELVKFIRNERRKELCFEGHRWFDLRRYAVNTTYPESYEILHPTYVMNIIPGVGREATVIGNTVLTPYDETSKGSWILPIPDDVVDYCQGSLINLLREGVERPN